LQAATLEHTLRTHAGHFLCERIHAPEQTREAEFRHVPAPPVPVELPAGLPAGLGRLDEFYRHFGSVLLYHHEASDDAARFIAPVADWPSLRAQLDDWTAIADGDDDDALPAWLASALVIGETPASGNYILMAIEGECAGRVFEFDHDGFEFTERGQDLFDYVARWLRADNTMLVDMASHMRFIDGDPFVQWWIRELHDAGGLRASTSAG
jgi:hypothetical protein